MQIFFLDPIHTFFIDVFAWACFHLGLGFYSSKIPVEKINPEQPFFQTYPWEKGGKIYQDLFHVRSWKRFMPQGSKLYRNTFSIQNLASLDLNYLERFLCESIRAEICHWMMVIPGFLFFLWNSTTVGWFMVVYAALNNFFPIVAQRFNRPRIRRLLEQVREQAGAIELAPSSEGKHNELANSGFLLSNSNQIMGSVCKVALRED